MDKKNVKQDMPKEDLAEEWDFSEGFGGLPDDADLTGNIGCASGRRKGKAEKDSEDKV
ncbi:hypothetical protein KIH41_14275 [Litoribacter ruber]|uniref:Uncharacterized protein n=1 Tax=Litoribacter ruber TaxID=702568 RepID=A0AAP2CH03_9BACT|nr:MULTISPECIES: hypothetical protein [Litoribacter]MBS9523424.1 hypothetical protein [Litoribacter alkaliphilus]MBT0812450.1 hypothetical protein [Litoribacter ruber]